MGALNLIVVRFASDRKPFYTDDSFRFRTKMNSLAVDGLRHRWPTPNISSILRGLRDWILLTCRFSGRNTMVSRSRCFSLQRTAELQVLTRAKKRVCMTLHHSTKTCVATTDVIKSPTLSDRARRSYGSIYTVLSRRPVSIAQHIPKSSF